MGRRPPARLVLALALVITGCTYADREPGLFGRPGSSQPSTPDDSSTRPGPALPVVAETVWTAGNGVDLQVRIAVHAVRRIMGGTVLDYSLTPLADGNHLLGSPLPRTATWDCWARRRGNPRSYCSTRGMAGSTAR